MFIVEGVNQARLDHSPFFLGSSVSAGGVREVFGAVGSDDFRAQGSSGELSRSKKMVGYD